MNYSEWNKVLTRVNKKRNRDKSEPRSSRDDSDVHASDNISLLAVIPRAALAILG